MRAGLVASRVLRAVALLQARGRGRQEPHPRRTCYGPNLETFVGQPAIICSSSVSM